MPEKHGTEQGLNLSGANLLWFIKDPAANEFASVRADFTEYLASTSCGRVMLADLLEATGSDKCEVRDMIADLAKSGGIPEGEWLAKPANQKRQLSRRKARSTR